MAGNKKSHLVDSPIAGQQPTYIASAVLIWLPFRSLLAFPVENALGIMDRRTSIEALGIQWGWIALMFVLCAIVWRAGTRRFAAFGG